VGCWAHARRKFDEALKVQGGKKTGRAQIALNEIRKLYAVERDIKTLSAAEKYTQRQERAKPVALKLRAWLTRSLPEVAPKTTLGKALRYLDNEWPRLVPYLDNGELPIDNNACENAIRPFVIGRKNWLFSQSVDGAQASATIYSLIETARLNGQEPYRYLRYVLTEIAGGNEDYESLLPHNLDPVRTAD
jgi:transposase